MKEAKKKSQTELAEVVRKHNAKYNEMLAQRLVEEEAAKEAAVMAAGLEWEGRAVDRERTLREQMQAQVSAVRELQAQLAEAKAAAAEAGRRREAVRVEAAQSGARADEAERRAGNLGSEIQALREQVEGCRRMVDGAEGRAADAVRAADSAQVEKRRLEEELERLRSGEVSRGVAGQEPKRERGQGWGTGEAAAEH